MSAQANATLARTIYDAFIHHDVARILAMATEDVRVVTVTFGQTTQRGHDGLRHVMEGWTAMAPDGRVEVIHQWAGAQGVTNEGRFRGTHTGPWQSPIGEIPPTGRTFDVPFVAAWQITEGKLSSVHHTVDIMTLLRQLGLDPLPAIPQRYLHFAVDAPAVCAESPGAVVLTGAGMAA